MTRPARKTKQQTVTFQQEPDVAEILGKIKKGARSKAINEAVRKHHRQAALNIAVRELMLAEARVKALRDSCED